jgi:hypothetical protein
MTDTIQGNGKRPLHDADAHAAPVDYQVGGPVSTAWGEGTLTRAKELEALLAWLRPHGTAGDHDHLAKAIAHHLEAAREAASHKKQRPWRPVSGFLIERAISNLDAAEADLLQLAPADYLLGQMPAALNHVQRHLGELDRAGRSWSGSPARSAWSTPTTRCSARPTSRRCSRSWPP